MKFKFVSIREPDPEVNLGRSITFVEITWGNGFRISGEAVKHPNEPFNKALGQKYAIADALIHIDRASRKEVWFAFANYSKASDRVMK